MNNIHRIRRFLDAQERLSTWPAKRKNQILVLEYLAAQFEPQRYYSEKEVNTLLNAVHTCGDCALLRRYLYNYAFLDRTRDGARYWRLDPALRKAEV